DGGRAPPLLDQADRTVEMAVRLPLRVEHRRLGGDAHVLGQRRQNLAVPGLLRESERSRGVERHYRLVPSAAHTRSGFSGMSRCLTPTGPSAATPTLTIARELPTV